MGAPTETFRGVVEYFNIRIRKQYSNPGAIIRIPQIVRIFECSILETKTRFAYLFNILGIENFT